MKSVLNGWVQGISLMQQSVLISAIRGCDGLPKFHKAKPLIKWYRRCILLSAFDQKELTDPFSPGGGSFTGPLADLHGPLFEALPYSTQHGQRCDALQKATDDFLDSRDEIHQHYYTHMMHAFEIIGYKHPDKGIAEFWLDIYIRMARAFHLYPETEAQLDERLGDNMEGWLKHSDISSHCTD